MPSKPTPSIKHSKKTATKTKGKKKPVPNVPKCSTKRNQTKKEISKEISISPLRVDTTPTNFSVTKVPKKTGNTNPLVGVVELSEGFKFNAKKPWCFTWYYPNENELKEICSVLENVSKYIFQLELTKTLRTHLQGYIYFNKKDRPDRYLKQFTNYNKIHWELFTRGSFKQNVDYCSKLDSRKYPLQPPYTNITLPKPIVIEDLCLTWHFALDYILKSEPNRRTTDWWWSSEGSFLKTLFVRYYTHLYRETTLLVAGCASDVKCQILERMEKGGLYPTTIFINLSKDYDPDKFDYNTLEELKDAVFAGGKYKGGMMPPQNRPHVVVFANFPPATCRMTKNRFRIKQLDLLTQSLPEAREIKRTLRSITNPNNNYIYPNTDKYIMNRRVCFICKKRYPEIDADNLQSNLCKKCHNNEYSTSF